MPHRRRGEMGNCKRMQRGRTIVGPKVRPKGAFVLGWDGFRRQKGRGVAKRGLRFGVAQRGWGWSFYGCPPLPACLLRACHSGEAQGVGREPQGAFRGFSDAKRRVVLATGRPGFDASRGGKVARYWACAPLARHGKAPGLFKNNPGASPKIYRIDTLPH